MHRRSSIVDRPSSIVGILVVCFLCCAPAAAQERFRLSANVAAQGTTSTVSQDATFDRYFEQGSSNFERTVPSSVLFDFGGTVRVWRELHAGAAVSIFDQTGSGTLTAHVPHPLQFNKPRTTTGDVANARRSETGTHITVGWMLPAANGLDFLLFAGPSFFATEQLFVKSLTLSLSNEVFPFDELAFPAIQTETLSETVAGYNLGVDMTWRFARHFGAGLLLRYANGKKAFAPTGSTPVEVTVGGLHAGGGLRVLF